MDSPLLILLLAVTIIGNIMFFYYWWQAFSYFKENNALAFYYYVFFIFDREKFKPEGNSYRIKAIIALVFTLLAIITLIGISAR